EHEPQHGDMSERLDHRPAIAEPAFAKPGAGLADDERVEDAALAAEGIGQPLRPARRRAGLAPAMDQRVGVDRAEAAAEEVEHRGRGLVVVRVLAEDAAAQRCRLAEPAAGEKRRELLARGEARAIRGVSRRRYNTWPRCRWYSAL